MNRTKSNLPYLKERRKELRSNSTSAEAILWVLLKSSQLCGRKFRRQHSIGNYILDFYCPKEKIALELDGDLHFRLYQLDRDEQRTKFLNEVGITVVRIENKQVFENQEAVLRYIADHFNNDIEFNHPQFTS
jgi:very-short-patch-repair endonuclease